MSEWRIVFFVAAAFYFFGNLVFVVLGKATIQPWNEVEEKQRNSAEIEEESLGEVSMS